MAARIGTDEVFNQSPPYEDVDLFGSDRPLLEAVAANGAGDDAAALGRVRPALGLGRDVRAGAARQRESAELSLRRQGPQRLVEFHPAYHHFMAESMREGLHASTWQPDGTPAAAPAEVARAARFYMVAQVENGHMCPITMTRASVAALAAAPALRGALMPKIAAREYDPSFRPWAEKSGITLGMGMTEKQGGTDVRANTTRAERDGDGYRITGHKWFMSAPMCDAFLVLAQAHGGADLFLHAALSP